MITCPSLYGPRRKRGRGEHAGTGEARFHLAAQFEGKGSQTECLTYLDVLHVLVQKIPGGLGILCSINIDEAAQTKMCGLR